MGLRRPSTPEYQGRARPRPWSKEEGVDEGVEWAVNIFTQDLPLARWLVHHGHDILRQSTAFRVALSLLDELLRKPPGKFSMLSSEEAERREREARWLAGGSVGGKPGRVKRSADARRRSLRELVVEMCPHRLGRHDTLTRRGGCAKLVEEHRRRFPTISRSTAYEDLKWVRAELGPKRIPAR